MSKIWVGPVGKVVKGHVLDVNVKAFGQALKELDKRLYVRWNPEKIKNHGCWEIRISPSKPVALHMGTWQGTDFYSLEYIEQNTIHHILDCAFLNYDALRKLKEMDTANPKHFIHSLEYDEQVRTNERYQRARDERTYAIKQNRTAIKELYERARSGENLHKIVGESNWTLKTDEANYKSNPNRFKP